MLLKFIRKNKKLFFISIFLLVLLPFLFFGIGSIGEKSGQKNKAASIHGKEISPAKLKEAQFYSQVMLFIDFVEGNKIKSPEQFDMYKDWFNQIMDQIDLNNVAIQEIILQKQADIYGIEITTAEITNWISNFPLFQTQGVFDINRYNAIVTNYFHSWPAQFEQALAQILSIKKLRQFIMDTVLVSEKETYIAYKEANEKAVMYYVDFNTSDYLKNVGDIDEAQLKIYYEENKEQFRKPERIKIAYILFDPSAYKEKAEISQKEIEDFYESRKEEYKDKDGTIKPIEKINEEIQKQLAEKKAEDICQNTGLDLSIQLTEEKKIGDMFRIAGEKGFKIYETDYLSKEQIFIPELGQAQQMMQIAWRMDIGTISDLLRVNNKWVIISPKDKRPIEIPEFTEVKSKINEILRNQKAKELAKNAAEETFKKLQKGTSFTMAVKPLGFKAKKTNPIVKTNELFSLTTRIINTQKGATIVSPKKIYPIDEKKWEKEKENFTKTYSEQKKRKFFQEWLTNIAKS